MNSLTGIQRARSSTKPEVLSKGDGSVFLSLDRPVPMGIELDVTAP